MWFLYNKKLGHAICQLQKSAKIKMFRKMGVVLFYPKKAISEKQ